MPLRRAAEALEQALHSDDYDRFSVALFGYQNAIELWDGNIRARRGLSEVHVHYAQAALKKGDFDLGLSVLDQDATEHRDLADSLRQARHERDLRQHRLRRMRRAAAGLAAGLVIVMTVALVWIRSAERSASNERDIACTQKSLAERNSTRAYAAVEELSQLAEKALEDIPLMQPVRRRLLEKALGFHLEFLDELPDDPAVNLDAARAWDRVGDIRHMLGQHQDTQDAYNEAIIRFDELLNDSPDQPEVRRELALSHNFIGESWRQLGDTARAEDQYSQAHRLQLQLKAAHPSVADYRQELARTSYNLGLLYWSSNRPEESRNAYDAAVDLLEALVDDDPGQQLYRQELARARLNRGILNRDIRRQRDARQDFDDAIALLRLLRDEAPRKREYRYELAKCCNSLGNMLLPNKDHFEEAERCYREALGLFESLVDDFPGVVRYRTDLANAVNSLAALFYFAQDFDQAERQWQRSRQIAEKLVQDQPDVPENRSLLGRTLGNLGSLMLSQKDYAAARPLLQQAIDTQNSALKSNPKHPGFRAALRNYTWTLTEALLGAKDHRAAAISAAQLPDTLPGDPGELFRAASLTARCVALCEADETLTPPERTATRASCVAQSLQLLEQAIQAGFTDADKLDSDESLAPIRSHEKYSQLRARLQTDADRAGDENP